MAKTKVEVTGVSSGVVVKAALIQLAISTVVVVVATLVGVTTSTTVQQAASSAGEQLTGQTGSTLADL